MPLNQIPGPQFDIGFRISLGLKLNEARRITKPSEPDIGEPLGRRRELILGSVLYFSGSAFTEVRCQASIPDVDPRTGWVMACPCLVSC